MMAAYFIAVRTAAKDLSAFRDYAPLAQKSLPPYNGKIIAARGEHRTAEGDPVDSVIVIEFPDYAAANAWYDSPAYQEALVHRFRGGEYRSFIVDGAIPAAG